MKKPRWDDRAWATWDALNADALTLLRRLNGLYPCELADELESLSQRFSAFAIAHGSDELQALARRFASDAGRA